MLFDSHSHLHFYQFDSDREEIMEKLRDFNIKTINVGTDFKESEKAVKLAEKYPDLMWASVGLHPNDNQKEIFYFDKYKKLAESKKVVAIGECGFDYFRYSSKIEIKRQKEIFMEQIKLAEELNKPLILHCRPSAESRDAYKEAIEILKYKNLNISNGNGAAHFFSGSKEIARQFLDLEFYISFTGPITFASEYRGVVEFVPLEKILVETDAPFAAPVPYRGKRNEPAYVEFIVRRIAEWKGLSFDKVAAQTHNNAKALFKI